MEINCFIRAKNSGKRQSSVIMPRTTALGGLFAAVTIHALTVEGGRQQAVQIGSLFDLSGFALAEQLHCSPHRSERA
jgi:hypothetical protein